MAKKTLPMNPTPSQIVQALPHVRYEIESLLQTPDYDPSNLALKESVYFRKMAHCRALYWFFTTPGSRRREDDVLCEDFGFKSERLYSGEARPLLDQFNKRLFHLTHGRIREKRPWPMLDLLQPVMGRSRRFVDHVLQTGAIQLDDEERRRWRALKNADARRFPLEQDTSNVATHQIRAFEGRGGS